MNTASSFHDRAAAALENPVLQQALGHARARFIDKREAAVKKLPEFDALRDRAIEIKDHVLAHLPFYLDHFARQVEASGGQVHWCDDADAARKKILDICQKANARTVAKGKTMVGEEIALNDFLQTHGIRPVETDLGEYLVQIRKETPSHIVAPALHITKEQAAADFRAHHRDRDPSRKLDHIADLLAEARSVLRQEFLQADVGITGANLLVAETGSTAIVTNEGNGDLSQSLPQVHIVLAGFEKLVPTLEDAAVILRLLARSATGQEASVYTSFSTGPRRGDDVDGPREFHVVLLDNGRSRLLGGEFQEMLRCIRCGACLNHCPVYQAIGGHAYGWVYPGPMGAVLTPTLNPSSDAATLPFASTLCGRCEDVCPMRIPLPRMLRALRHQAFARGLVKQPEKLTLATWSWVVKHRRLYRIMLAGMRPALRWKLVADLVPPLRSWRRQRALPVPQVKGQR